MTIKGIHIILICLVALEKFPSRWLTFGFEYLLSVYQQIPNFRVCQLCQQEAKLHLNG